MRKKHVFLVFIIPIMFLIIISFKSPAKNNIGDIGSLKDTLKNKKLDKTKSVKADLDFGNIPLYFVQNRGQVDKRALFYARASHYTLWVTKQGLIFDSIRLTNRKYKMKVGRDNFPQLKYNRDISRLLFCGINPDIKLSSLRQSSLKVNYFIGNDKSKWKGSTPASLSILYTNIYNNIDLKVYGIEKEIEYDWIVKPGGNASDIIFEFDNIKEIKIDNNGDLKIKTQFGYLVHKKPVAYQVFNSKNISNETKNYPVTICFKKMGKNRYGFDVGKYDYNYTLIIDPVILEYSTYLGGSSSEIGDAITVDNKGNVYVTGRSLSQDFPVLNEYKNYFQVGVFVSKIDTKKSGIPSLVYSTFLGGGTGNAYGYGIAVDDKGFVYVTGHTSSSDFPILNYFQSHQGQNDVFITKLDTNRSGVSSLLYSTYFGGVYFDIGRGIECDNKGLIYIVGVTHSSDFPLLNQYQASQGGYDCFVAKFDTNRSGNASLLYSTYLGGSGSDLGYGIAVDDNEYVYVTGQTSSTNFPILNQYMTKDPDNTYDAFLTKLDTSKKGTASLVYSTYLGGTGLDRSSGIAVDNTGNVYVAGTTWSTNFPTINQYQTNRSESDCFVSKIDTNLSGPFSLVYSTYLGGCKSEEVMGIGIDEKFCVYISGFVYSPDFPTKHQFQDYQGVYDCFVAKIDTSRNGISSLIYSTYLGTSGNDIGRAIAVDTYGYSYVTGYTISTNFPLINQYMTHPGDDQTNIFVTKLSPVVNPEIIYHMNVSVLGEGGSVDKVYNKVYEGEKNIINIYPNQGFMIGSITDNEEQVNIANPYIVYNIKENHNIEITFIPFAETPELILSGTRIAENAWLIRKEFSQLQISIKEHLKNPLKVSSYILFKFNYGKWIELEKYESGGNYTYIDKCLLEDEIVSYKLVAIQYDSSERLESKILTL